MNAGRDGVRARWQWLGGYFRRRRRIVLFGLVAGAATAAANVALLLLLSHALNVAIPAGHVTGLLFIGAAMIASRAIAAFVSIWMTRLSSTQVSVAIADMQGAMASRLHRLRWRDLNQLDAASANARMVHDAHTVAQMAMRISTSALPALAPFLASLVVLFLIDWRLAAIVLVLLPVTRAIHGLGAWRLRAATHGFWDAFDVFHRRTKQLLHMLPATRMHGVAERELASHRATADSLAVSQRSLVAGVAVSEQAGALGTTILLAAILAGGGLAVADGAMSVGTLTAFLVAATQAQGALTAAAGAIPVILSGDAALVRIRTLQTSGNEEDNSDRAPPRPASLAFEQVGARIGDRQIMTGVSFELLAGESMAIVAPNGEGKTTLLHIALGLIDCDEGRVTVNGIDLAGLDRERWRRSIGILPQHPLFANAGLGENIDFALAEDGMGHASSFAGLDALMDTIPGGRELPTGENGALLSGGERQRAAIARALAASPSLLVLDEPSNHLDAHAVALLIEQLFMGRERPTILMATHDARLLRHVNRVHRLENGRLIPLEAPAAVAIAS